MKQGLLQVAATDAPLSDDQLKGFSPVIQMPIAVGPVCAVYNLPTLKAPLRLSGPTLAGIFLGKIISWQDPAIAHDNPGVQLPHAAIIVVHRSDGSGTTSIFSAYLAKVSPEWAHEAGQGLTVKWPVGIGEQGSRPLLQFVSETAGTIGYAELNYAREKHLPVASIENRAGGFIAPSASSVTAAIESFSGALSRDIRTPIVDPPASAKDAYPITGLTFLLITWDGADAQGRQPFATSCSTPSRTARASPKAWSTPSCQGHSGARPEHPRRDAGQRAARQIHLTLTGVRNFPRCEA